MAKYNIKWLFITTYGRMKKQKTVEARSKAEAINKLGFYAPFSKNVDIIYEINGVKTWGDGTPRKRVR